MRIDFLAKFLFTVLLAVFFVFFTFPSDALAATYYVATTGSGTDCTSAAPCAFSRLTSSTEPRPSPGETWLLRNGTYSTGLVIDCNVDSVNGTASQPITIRAENERQAFISGDGVLSRTFSIINCSYWVIDGLRIENADNAIWNGFEVGEVVLIENSNNITLRRLLLRFPNTCGLSAHDIQASNSANVLIEENEIYSFGRQGIKIESSNNTIVRRNYIKRRSPTLCGVQGGPPVGIGNYSLPTTDVIFENNI